MVNDKVCIILVNYNGYLDTIECVKSIMASTYKNIEIILVENASKDVDSIKVDVFLNQNTNIVISENNLGFSGGNNLGIKYAIEKYKPKYLMLLNNDTVIEPDTIENLLEMAEKNNNVGIVTGKINYYSKKNTIWAACGKFDFKTGIADQPAMGEIDSGQYDVECEITFSSGCLMFIPIEAYNKVGDLDESYFMYAEDTDYCCRMMKSGYKIFYTGKAVIYHKVSASAGNHSVNQQYYMFRNNCYITQKYCNSPMYGYLRRFYRTVKEIKRGEYQIKNVKRAWKDFRHGITGMVELSK